MSGVGGSGVEMLLRGGVLRLARTAAEEMNLRSIRTVFIPPEKTWKV